MSSSSSSSTNASIAPSVAEQKPKIDWLKKAQRECIGYDQHYPEAIAAVQTAIRILGKITKEENHAKYLVIKCLHDHLFRAQSELFCTQSELYQSICCRDEVRIIEKSYASLCRGQKKGLETISYFRNNPKLIDIQNLSIILPQSPITSLNLGGNDIGDTGAQSLSLVLAKTQITSLNLRGNNIGATGAQNLSLVLPMTQITSLGLSGNSIGDTGAQSLSLVLAKTQITSLGLGRNNIGATGAQSLSQVLAKTQITSLGLGGNSIGVTGAQSLFQVLAKTQITSLSLGGNSIGDTGAQGLFQVLAKTQITSLELGSNSIGATGAQSLSLVLPMTQITNLDLGFNSIGDIGVKNLSLVLPMTQITNLDLGFNSIGDIGVQSLSQVLAKTQITSLGLGGNPIGDTGVQSLSLVLAKTQITSLGLGENSIGVTGAQSLSQVLAKTQITSLYLCESNIGATGVQSLSQVLAKTQISHLNLYGNSIGDTGVNDLIEAIAEVRFQGKTINIEGVEGIDETKIAEAMGRLKLKYEQKEKVQKEAEEKAKQEQHSLSEVSEAQKTIVERLQQLPQEKLLNERLFVEKQKELEKLIQQLPKVQGKDLQLLQTNAQELRQLITKQQELQCKEAEIQRIQSHDALKDYYYTFLILFTDALTACKAIHAKAGPAQTANSQMDMDDYVMAGVNALGQQVPVVSMLTSALSGTHSFLSQRSKLQKINQIVRFLPTMTEGDLWAETLARKLTLAQETKLRAIPSQQVGLIRRAIAAGRSVKCWITADDINNAIRRLASEQCETLITHIISGQCSAKLSDIPLVVVTLLGSQSVSMVSSSTMPTVIHSSSASDATSRSSSSTSTAIVFQAPSMVTTLPKVMSSSSSHSSAIFSASSLTYDSCSSMTFQAMSMSVSQNAARFPSMEEFREMQERLLQAEAELKATREKAEKAEREAKATKKAVEQSGISVSMGENSVQVLAHSPLNSDGQDLASQRVNDEPLARETLNALIGQGILKADKPKEKPNNKIRMELLGKNVHPLPEFRVRSILDLFSENAYQHFRVDCPQKE